MAIVTISRQHGSGGDHIAALVADQLGYRMFDKQVMAQVAHDAGLSEAEVVDFKESSYKGHGFLDQLFGALKGWVPAPDARPVGGASVGNSGTASVGKASTWSRDDWGGELEVSHKLDEDRSVNMVRATIEAAHKHGNLVVLGRGGQYILRDRPNVLHVRVEAPLADRVRTVAARLHVSASEAEPLIAQRDRQSSAYLKRFYGIDWADPLLYHLLINTGRWDVETAAKLICTALGMI